MTTDMADVGQPKRRTTASMEQAARRILTARGINPDELADQGELATDLGVQRRTISVYRRGYRLAERGRGRSGPHPSTGEAAVEPFPDPAKTIGGTGFGGSPIWQHRWVGLAWGLTREQALARLSDDERALIEDLL